MVRSIISYHICFLSDLVPGLLPKNASMISDIICYGTESQDESLIKCCKSHKTKASSNVAKVAGQSTRAVDLWLCKVWGVKSRELSKVLTC